MKKRNWKRLLASALTLALTLGSLGAAVSVHASEDNGEPVYGGILNVSREGTMGENDLYPHLKMNTQAYVTMAPAIEKLFYLNAQGEMVPQLATSWDVSEDGLTYTFHLAEGVKFHDGSDFNAEVAKWNLDQAKAVVDELGTGTSNGAMESATVIDDHTLEVKFSTMYATLFLALDVYMASQKAYEENGVEWCSKNPVGTGPFVFDHWTLDSELVYTKNENYWVEGQPYLDGITFKVIKENSVLSASMKSGEVDLIHYAPSTDLMDALRDEPGVTTLISEQSSGFTEWIPCGLETSPFRDENVRKAIAYGVDFAAIVDSIGADNVVYSNQFAIDSNMFYNSNVVNYEYDPEKAMELLKEAGYDDSNPLSVELITENVPAHKLMSEAIQAYLLQIGVNCEINVMEGAAYFDNVIVGTWEDDWLVNMGTGSTAYCPLTGINRLMGANHAKMFPCVYFPDEWVENVVESAAQLTLEEAVPCFQKANEVMFNDYCGMYGIRCALDTVFIRDYVRNYNMDNQIIQFGTLWKTE
ncbi:MAG: ABC transporter substrate-binding protein [Blautia sp.]|nr:ABC transporter substrate-binding protein [Blautia sp.]